MSPYAYAMCSDKLSNCHRLVVNTGWVMEKTIEDHTKRVKEHFVVGRMILASLRAPDLRSYDVPDVTVDRTVLFQHLPLEGDK